MMNFTRRVYGGAANTHAGIGAAARLIHLRKTSRCRILYHLIAAKLMRAARRSAIYGRQQKNVGHECPTYNSPDIRQTVPP